MPFIVPALSDVGLAHHYSLEPHEYNNCPPEDLYQATLAELAFARFLGPDAHAYCCARLARSKPTDDDYRFDILHNGVKIDVKTAMRRTNSKNLVLNQRHDEVRYVLLDEPNEWEHGFLFAGWSSGRHILPARQGAAYNFFKHRNELGTLSTFLSI